LELTKSKKRVRIKQVQIEQDTAKSTHVGGEIHHDLNRAGMPLLEIVSLPDLSSPEEAGEYVRTLQAVLRSVAVGDGMMEAVSLWSRVSSIFHVVLTFWTGITQV
jgi:aspartyl-tRNA(Asn)/glutamyl-tRNA(Gln) amidotransferase subunit B